MKPDKHKKQNSSNYRKKHGIPDTKEKDKKKHRDEGKSNLPNIDDAGHNKKKKEYKDEYDIEIPKVDFRFRKREIVAKTDEQISLPPEIRMERIGKTVQELLDSCGGHFKKKLDAVETPPVVDFDKPTLLEEALVVQLKQMDARRHGTTLTSQARPSLEVMHSEVASRFDSIGEEGRLLLVEARNEANRAYEKRWHVDPSPLVKCADLYRGRHAPKPEDTEDHTTITDTMIGLIKHSDVELIRKCSKIKQLRDTDECSNGGGALRTSDGHHSRLLLVDERGPDGQYVVSDKQRDEEEDEEEEMETDSFLGTDRRRRYHVYPWTIIGGAGDSILPQVAPPTSYPNNSASDPAHLTRTVVDTSQHVAPPTQLLTEENTLHSGGNTHHSGGNTHQRGDTVQYTDVQCRRTVSLSDTEDDTTADDSSITSELSISDMLTRDLF